ncbi:MAG: hypothetical protein OWQ56_10165 [Acidithiobacillus caldus]|nr:hypothetical protein [Acidithiobacillus caldus]
MVAAVAASVDVGEAYAGVAAQEDSAASSARKNDTFSFFLNTTSSMAFPTLGLIALDFISREKVSENCDNTMKLR